MKQSQTKTGKTVFHTVMQPLVVLILLQAAILLTFLYLSGIFDQVNSNERAILSKQVANRANYLESQMTQQWADIGALAASINEKTQAAVDAGELSLDRLESSSKEAAKLIGQICTDMIETMYRNKVSGIYVIFSTSNLDGNTESKNGFPRARPRPDGERDDAVQRPFAGMCADLDRQGDEHRDRHGLGYAL